MADFAKLLGEKMAKAAEASRAPVPETIITEQINTPTEQGREEPRMPLETSKPSSLGLESPGASITPPAAKAGPKAAKSKSSLGGSNLNRVTVNLFDADRRALAIIKEHLSNAGQDFTNRSDSIKIGLRLAAKAKKEELAALLKEVRGEDRRFTGQS